MPLIAKRFTFHAAHHIPHHQGKCRQPHGHTYVCEVQVQGEIQRAGPEGGMVMDFGRIKQVWEAELEPLLDHQDLNVTLADYVRFTTAELLAGFILDVMGRYLDGKGGTVIGVRLWETPTSYAYAEAA